MPHPGQPNPEQVDAAVNALRLLADPTRLQLLWKLGAAGESDVAHLVETTGMPRPSVSQHLAKLRLAGLVATRRDGRHIYYRVTSGHVRRLVTEVLSAADHLLTGTPEHD